MTSGKKWSLPAQSGTYVIDYCKRGRRPWHSFSVCTPFPGSIRLYQESNMTAGEWQSVIFYLWDETTSLNCCHERTYCSSPRWYMRMENDGGMTYWQGKTEDLGEKPVPVSLCTKQIPHELTRARTRDSALRGRH
jgi:hypothetical protein